MRLIIVTLFIVILVFNASAQKPQQILDWVNSATALNHNFYYELPFEYKQGEIIIKAKIGDSTYNYIFDTGGYNTVTDNIAERNNLKILTKQQTGSSNLKKTTVNIVKVDDIQIGEVVFKDLAALQLNLNNLPIISCLSNGGLIGRSIIKEYIWQIDYPRRKIIITDQFDKLPNMQQAVAIPIELDKRLTPFIRIVVNGQEERCMFDLGSSQILSFPKKQGEKYLKNEKIIEIEGAGSEGVAGTLTEVVKVVNIKTLGIGAVQLNNVATTVQTQPDILIGSPIIKNYIVTLNYARKEIYLTQLSNPELKEGLESFGFTVRYQDGNAKVFAIYKSLPADKAGLQIGDTILSIDETPLQYNDFCDCLFTSPRLLENKNEVTLVVLKKGKEETIKLKKEKAL
ncbi:aspartyl protease family protein [Chitinophagaceae bacterium LWZ2-11]